MTTAYMGTMVSISAPRATRPSMGSKRMTSGIHHFTGITANVQANVDFYVGFLGHRLVKQTEAMRTRSSCISSMATGWAARAHC
jgi:hypothetical protein